MTFNTVSFCVQLFEANCVSLAKRQNSKRQTFMLLLLCVNWSSAASDVDVILLRDMMHFQ